MKKISILLFIIISIFLFSCAGTKTQVTPPTLLKHRGQEIFASGMNLAWGRFAIDLLRFDEKLFTRALDDIVKAGGNTMRWWLYVNGTSSPIFENNKVTSPGPNDIASVKRALDLAWDRGMLLVLCLWSHDVFAKQVGSKIEQNRLLIENKEYTKAFIDNALVPLVKAVKDHPAILAWEVMNEPEGITKSFGWQPFKTEMSYIQQFVNLVAGGIHRADPKSVVTNGIWNIMVCTDVKGFTNYYRDDRLIKAGGDPLGTLDFYQVHYYPEYQDEMTSPFHHPASYWKLDKPIMVGEFPAKGLMNLGKGYMPSTKLTSEDAYGYLFMNGYAGALGWTWTNHDGFGGVDDAAPGMRSLKLSSPANIVIDQGADFNESPKVVKKAKIEDLKVKTNGEPVKDYIDLTTIFTNKEDGTALTYTVAGNSKPDVVNTSVDASGKLSFSFVKDGFGIAELVVRATDKKGKFAETEFFVYVIDPERGNIAMLKPATSSGDESPEQDAAKALDGNQNSRWSSSWADNRWMIVDLKAKFRITRVVIFWEAAFGKEYTIDVSEDGTNWTTVFTEKASDGGIDDIRFGAIPAQYVKMNGIKRATQWGFSIWEFEVYPAAK